LQYTTYAERAEPCWLNKEHRGMLPSDA